ncbi:alpha/beta hydrolase [Streptomyces sp. APSN-46.1]|uniref:alpha/beta fold hydrolase n=1 Tax=Streptomyces sp. APSN-46.1 TaxID=2929049 RepID=UPI001FB1D1C1|nr:alpha/beta hydrolase [Streptomyces sp. APSN-46.1]MCJ1680075.1 alpha/beta hydrolase [Streptomyces sp. APSN-46.1]
MTTDQEVRGTAPPAERPVTVRLVREATVPHPRRVLLLHGLCSSGAVWDPYVALADERCELWAAELPWRGTGVAGWTSRPVEDWVEEAVALVPDGPDVLVAHSFGTSTVLSWLDRRGDRDGGTDAADTRGPRGVVLVSPLYRAETHDFDWQSIEYYLNNFVRILTDGMRASMSRKLPARHERDIALKVRDYMGPYGWIHFFGTYLRMPYVRTERLRMPFLVVCGDEDRVAHPADAEAFAKAVPDASVHLLPGSEHFPMVTSPALFADLVNTFVRALDA